MIVNKCEDTGGGGGGGGLRLNHSINSAGHVVHQLIRISIKEIIDVFESTQQRRMKLVFLLDDATENSDENNIFIF